MTVSLICAAGVGASTMIGVGPANTGSGATVSIASSTRTFFMTFLLRASLRVYVGDNTRDVPSARLEQAEVVGGGGGLEPGPVGGHGPAPVRRQSHPVGGSGGAHDGGHPGSAN